LTKKERRNKRKRRMKYKIRGDSDRPRLSVFRSNKHIYVQVIDDEKGKTLESCSDKEIKSKKNLNKSDRASTVGRELGKKLKKKKIEKIVFDRSGYKYYGRVKALAEALREAGIDF